MISFDKDELGTSVFEIVRQSIKENLSGLRAAAEKWVSRINEQQNQGG